MTFANDNDGELAAEIIRLREKLRATELRNEILQEFVRSVAWGPPSGGEPLALLNRFVTMAQALCPRSPKKS